MTTVVDTCWKDFIAGKENAFKRLYDDYADQLFDFGCKYCADESTVKDAIHDLFVELHRYREKLSPQVNVKSYLFTSLRRKVAAARQVQRKFMTFVEEPAAPGFTVEWTVEHTLIQDEQARMRYQFIADELKKLSQRQQEVLYLRFTAELTYEEASEIMGVSVATCRTMVFRAIKQLRINLAGRPQITNLLLLFFTMQERK